MDLVLFRGSDLQKAKIEKEKIISNLNLKATHSVAFFVYFVVNINNPYPMQFSHLHCHTQYSLLDGASKIPALFAKAKADNMPAIAITDHGNMFGAFQFVAEAQKHEGVKPIVGCEFYVVEDRHKRQFTKEQKDKRFHQLLLAKNANGYKNLVKLCSLGYIEGLYGKYPRITKAMIEQYKDDLIATTCCIGASVPQMILKKR